MEIRYRAIQSKFSTCDALPNSIQTAVHDLQRAQIELDRGSTCRNNDGTVDSRAEHFLPMACSNGNERRTFARAQTVAEASDPASSSLHQRSPHQQSLIINHVGIQNCLRLRQSGKGILATILQQIAAKTTEHFSEWLSRMGTNRQHLRALKDTPREAVPLLAVYTQSVADGENLKELVDLQPKMILGYTQAAKCFLEVQIWEFR